MQVRVASQEFCLHEMILAGLALSNYQHRTIQLNTEGPVYFPSSTSTSTTAVSNVRKLTQGFLGWSVVVIQFSKLFLEEFNEYVSELGSTPYRLETNRNSKHNVIQPPMTKKDKIRSSFQIIVVFSFLKKHGTDRRPYTRPAVSPLPSAPSSAGPVTASAAAPPDGFQIAIT